MHSINIFEGMVHAIKADPHLCWVTFENVYYIMISENPHNFGNCGNLCNF